MTFLYGAHVRANGIRLHYLRYGGQGAPLVIVPGITSPAITWGFVAERFGHTFDTYVMDVRGRGLSESGPQLDYGLNACAADVAAFTAALGFDRVHLLGHSMGARIAIRAARRELRALGRLLLVDPPVTGPGRRPYPAELAWYVDSIRLARRGATLDEMRTFLPTWNDEQLRLRAEWLHTCDEHAVREAYDGFHHDDIHQDLPHLGAPTRLIAAGRGGVILDEELSELTRLAPSMETMRVAGAGHMIPWDDFDGFFDAVGAFLGPRP
jgi:N-formylmaleamate deformylase